MAWAARRGVGVLGIGGLSDCLRGLAFWERGGEGVWEERIYHILLMSGESVWAGRLESSELVACLLETGWERGMEFVLSVYRFYYLMGFDVQFIITQCQNDATQGLPVYATYLGDCWSR